MASFSNTQGMHLRSAPHNEPSRAPTHVMNREGHLRWTTGSKHFYKTPPQSCTGKGPFSLERPSSVMLDNNLAIPVAWIHSQ